MPQPTPLRIHDFMGLETSKHPQKIGWNRSPDLLNVVLRDGTVRTRPGTTEEGSSSGTDKNLGLFEFRKTDGTVLYVRCQGGKIQKKAPGASTWDDLKTGLSTTAKWSAAVANNNIYLMNGVDTPQKWDGVAGSTTAVAAVKNGTTCAYKFERLVVGGVASDESSMWFSDAATPESFPSTNFFYCGKNDGGTIQEVLAGTASITITKQTGRFEWYGGTSVAQGPRKVSEYGTEGIRTAVVLPDGDIWLIGKGGVRRTRQFTDELVSGDVTGTLAGIDWSKLSQFATAVHDNYVLFAYTRLGQTVNDRVLIYDLIRRTWILWSLNAATLLSTQDSVGAPALIFGNATGNSKSYKLGSADGAENTFNDDGAAINAYYKTKQYDLQAWDKLKKWKKWFYLFVQQNTNYFATLGYNIDDTGFTNYLVGLGPESSLQYDEGNVYDTGLNYQDATKKEGFVLGFRTPWARTIQFKVSMNAANQPFHLLGMTPHYRVKRSIK